MPLEALRWPITPAGLHYLLIHYDVPLVDSAAFRLDVGGAVGRSLSLGLDDLRARPSIEVAVTMECAGNGRALLEPRPISQPWLTEAVGTARWRGVPLAALLDEIEPTAGAVDVVFAGIDAQAPPNVSLIHTRLLPNATRSACAGTAVLRGVPTTGA